MGCCNSTEDEFPSKLNRQDLQRSIPYDDTVYAYTRRNQQNYNTQHQQPKKTTGLERKIGEYKCGGCGRFWTSRYCWPDKYQNCKRCKRQVYPHQYRELQPSDRVKDNDDKHPHEKELCQMCQQLGYSCTTKTTRNYRRKNSTENVLIKNSFL